MISINYKDARPIYEQIEDGLRKLILSGAIPPDRKLPSVRELASQLAINPNTIQRAYRELEASGYIVSVPGKGSFPANVSELVDREKELLYAQLDEVAAKIIALGECPDKIAGHILGKEQLKND